MFREPPRRDENITRASGVSRDFSRTTGVKWAIGEESTLFSGERPKKAKCQRERERERARAKERERGREKRSSSRRIDEIQIPPPNITTFILSRTAKIERFRWTRHAVTPVSPTGAAVPRGSF